MVLATGALGAPVILGRSVETVSNQACFSGARGGCASSVNDNDGISGQDAYTYYSGTASNFPARSQWVSFDQMFTANTVNMLVSCGNNGWGANDSQDEINDIRAGIEAVAAISGVDHRFILSIIMQESVGCVRAPTTSNGVTNPGLMQSHNGVTYDPSNAAASIKQMIIDGTQGTSSGDGLAHGLNTYGDVYDAARVYNSGSIASSGDLSDANGATACYVSDVANRLTGWVNGARVCPGTSSGGGGGGSGTCSYTVASGDSCWAIWTKYGLTEATFRSYNPTLDSACDLQVGQVVSLCAGSSGGSCSQKYTVVSGDTCWAIWTKYGLTEATFRSMNPSLDSACDLYVGNVLCV